MNPAHLRTGRQGDAIDDDDSDEEMLRRIEAAEEARQASIDAAMQVLYGELPKWVPLPNIERARRTVAALMNDGFSAEHILARVTEAIEDRPVLAPGIVRDAVAYFRDINELAHLRYAISLGNIDGLLILAGEMAAHGQKFPHGKPKGAAGPMRKLIRRMIAAKGDRLTARELWLLCKALPESKRRGIEFYSDDAWIKGQGSVGFARFANLVSEEKKRPK